PSGTFKVPLYPFIPLLSGICCIGMMTFLSKRTFMFAGIWFSIGILIYLLYGYKHSKINQIK
ncbi:MAG: amino acid permease, partial [Lactobacillus iners]|nr:amino acid permease [Lactobacillus iners]